VIGEAVDEPPRQIAILASDHYAVEIVVAEEKPAAGPQEAMGLGDQRIPVRDALSDVLAQHRIEDTLSEGQPQDVSLDEEQAPGLDRGSVPEGGLLEKRPQPIKPDDPAPCTRRFKQRA
jgi:hypothetical protein